jgi:hypothetical protein
MPAPSAAPETRLAAWLLTAAFAGAPAAQAQAQVINKCRIDGRLVLQSAPCPIEAPAGALRAAESALTPAIPGAPHKRTLAEALRARDGGDPPPARTLQVDGAAVLRSRMGAL